MEKSKDELEAIKELTNQQLKENQSLEVVNEQMRAESNSLSQQIQSLKADYKSELCFFQVNVPA